MKLKAVLTLSAILLASPFALANEHEAAIEKHKQMLLKKFPNAEFTEIEQDEYKGELIYEYEFQFKGKAYEAFMTKEGRILRLGLDD